MEPSSLSRTHQLQSAIALMIATAMQALDATIANVALPQLEQSFGGGVDLGSWVMTSYLCASAVMATLTGWLRRRCGARRLFVGSISLFVIASALCSVAPSAATLIQFRLVQGAAAGVIQPLSQAILLDIYPEKDHGRMLAIWGATIMAGPIMGPILGGAITDLASWRWIFPLNIPLGLLAVLGLRRAPRLEERSADSRIDYIGIVLLIVGVGSLQLALQRSIGQPWPVSPEVMVEATLAIFAFIAIVLHGARSKFSPFKFQVFCNINFSTSAFYNFFVGGLLFTTIVFLPALSEGPLGYDATQAGLALSPRGIATMVTMVTVGYWINRIDNRALLAAGLLITASGLALMSLTPANGADLWLAAANAVQGTGVGLLFTPLSTLAFSTLGAELRTDAAGVYNLLRQLGCAAGVAIMTAVLQARIQAHLLAVPGHSETGAGSLSEAADRAAFAAYTGCFRMMAIATVMIVPGILFFRVLRPANDKVLPSAAYPVTVKRSGPTLPPRSAE